jgi:hypothetical protein
MEDSCHQRIAPIEKVKDWRSSIRFVVGAIIVFGFGVLSGQILLTSLGSNKNQDKESPLLTEGFDFKYFRHAEVEWRGPDIGAKIDLTRLSMKDGTTLASMVGTRPMVLASVNRNCAMCKTASDEMSSLSEKLSSINVDYYIVCFAPEASPLRFFDFSDSLKVDAPSFLWNRSSGAPAEAVVRMVTPAHLLVNRDGTVIRVWPGSYKDKAIRDRMMYQIAADASVTTDTLNALFPTNSPNP